MRRPRVACALALLLCAGAARVARAQGQGNDDDWLGRDKAGHFVASVAGAAGGHGPGAVGWGGPGGGARGGASLALAAGIGKELYDLGGHGDPSLRDLTWDVAGTLTGVALAWAIDRLLGDDDGGSENPGAASRGGVVVFHF